MWRRKLKSGVAGGASGIAAALVEWRGGIAKQH